jgi:hypothetical protein
MKENDFKTIQCPQIFIKYRTLRHCDLDSSTTRLRGVHVIMYCSSEWSID